ncbi:MAG: alpha-hydroxy-acid oxidizing protein [Nitrososphaeria archaeon]|nr:alpha-hydroxy-acid oxidizing protein [Nitrososphaeria archaeon]
MLEEKLKVVDAEKYNVRELNLELKRLSNFFEKIVLENPSGKHYIAAGLTRKVEIEVRGSVGYFLGTMIDGPSIIVEGNSGWFTGDNMTGGKVIVEGDAGNGVGQGLYGGKIIVKGDCGDRMGALMKNGTIIVLGNTGIMSGLYMMGGEIIVFGKTGEYTGESIIGGKIFFTGPEPSLGKNATVCDATEEEIFYINSILEENGLPKYGGRVRKILPENRRPFYSPKNAIKENVSKTRTRYQIILDHKLCKVCGTCVRVCPQEVFKKVGEDYITPLNELDCVGCETCIEFCPSKAIKIYPITEDTGLSWKNNIIREIQAKALIGKPIVRGTSAWRNFPSFDDLIILCAQTSRPPIDHYREPCETEVALGKRYAENPLRLKAPIIVGAMSFGAISKEAKIAIAKAATRVGIAVNTGEGGIIPEERENASILIAQYASGRFGINAKNLQTADAIEIKIGQGAKAGQGGLLMGEKVTAEIAAVRGIPVGTDAVSPARHLDIVGPEDLKMKIEQLREITDWRIPIIVKYSAGRVYDDVKIAAKAGADIIVVDGKQGGTGAAPDIILEHAGLPTLPALVEADRALKEIGLRDEVNLIISGGIRSGADIAKALALGADAVAMATPILVAMGCKVCGLCSTGKCPKGIATQDPVLRRRLKVEDAVERVENYLTTVIEELKMLTQLSGKTHVKNLEKDDLRALTLEASTITGVKLVGTE